MELNDYDFMLNVLKYIASPLFYGFRILILPE